MVTQTCRAHFKVWVWGSEAHPSLGKDIASFLLSSDGQRPVLTTICERAREMRVGAFEARAQGLATIVRLVAGPAQLVQGKADQGGSAVPRISAHPA
jgi:hypothetical protein